MLYVAASLVGAHQRGLQTPPPLRALPRDRNQAHADAFARTNALAIEKQKAFFAKCALLYGAPRVPHAVATQCRLFTPAGTARIVAAHTQSFDARKGKLAAMAEAAYRVLSLGGGAACACSACFSVH